MLSGARHKQACKTDGSLCTKDLLGVQGRGRNPRKEWRGGGIRKTIIFFCTLGLNSVSVLSRSFDWLEKECVAHLILPQFRVRSRILCIDF